MCQAYAYILTNDRHTVLYAGSTGDLATRIKQHKARQIPGFTQKYNICRLIYFEILPDLESAQAREQAFKRMPRARKVNLIKAANSTLQELLPVTEDG